MTPFDFMAIDRDDSDCAPASLEPAATLGQAATQALLDEVDLTPKPGLVDRRGAGAHHDMTHALMTRSAHTLRPGFDAMAAAAQHTTDPVALRAELGALGREAEAAMMRATGGVNTHRGAIWALGLIVAAAAGQPRFHWQASELLLAVAALAAIDDPALSSLPDLAPRSNGQRMAARFRVAGARREAMNGFIQITSAGLPRLRAARLAGADEQAARLDALLAIMAVLDDTCLLIRAGARGLAVAQGRAARILVLGGTSTAEGAGALAALDAALIDMHASPGGSADLLAATLLIDRLETLAGQPGASNPRANTHRQENTHANAIA
jgi:triphosphoribosyl-dephospho-CoA synthase